MLRDTDSTSRRGVYRSFLVPDELEELRHSLLRRLRVELGPEHGDAAFDQHVLLAARVHRVARLSQTVKGEGAGWEQLFIEFFPAGRSSRADAKLLWTKWRIGLVKDLAPASGVALAHGQRGLHWQLDMQEALVIDLESMCDDFEHAVNELVAVLAKDVSRRAMVMERWRERTWTVRPAQLLQQTQFRAGSRSTSFLPIGSTMAVSAVSVVPTKHRPTSASRP